MNVPCPCESCGFPLSKSEIQKDVLKHRRNLRLRHLIRQHEPYRPLRHATNDHQQTGKFFVSLHVVGDPLGSTWYHGPAPLKIHRPRRHGAQSGFVLICHTSISSVHLDIYLEPIKKKTEVHSEQIFPSGPARRCIFTFPKCLNHGMLGEFHEAA